MYKAYICYPYSDPEDEKSSDPILLFEEPDSWRYYQVLPISFTVLHSWTDADKKLYTK